MVNLPSLRYTRMQKNRWLSCAGLQQLHELLGLDKKELAYLHDNIKYDVFTIPKKNGAVRMIENPVPPLKEVQRSINDWLQAVYYFYKHPASYGFCMSVKKDQHPCNIYTHAKRHTGCHYLINADLKDFFHTVSVKKLTDVFTEAPFIHDAESIEWLCNITTYNGRLPTGSPASPVLSNLAATKFDEAMHALALRHQATYTRYADDMSFSCTIAYPPVFKDQILYERALMIFTTETPNICPTH